MNEFSVLLERARLGDEDARVHVIAVVYDELRALARHRLRMAHNASIQPTELVHEMYGRLFDKEQLGWESRRHFFAVAARAMQDILVERARAAVAQKRGGGKPALELSAVADLVAENPEELLALNDALARLAEHDPIGAEVVRLRYFVGFSVDETAHALNVSASTVDRRWAFARAWLHRELFGEASLGGTSR